MNNGIGFHSVWMEVYSVVSVVAVGIRSVKNPCSWKLEIKVW